MWSVLLCTLHTVFYWAQATTPSLFSQLVANVTSTGKMSYDAIGQRIRARNFGVNGNETFFVDQLMLFRQVADV